MLLHGQLALEKRDYFEGFSSMAMRDAAALKECGYGVLTRHQSDLVERRAPAIACCKFQRITLLLA
jgi:hypothetical protein